MKIAILATNGFEYSELTGPQTFLKEKGHDVHVISPELGEIESAHDDGSVSVDKKLADTNANDYDALVLPGGQVNPDSLRINAEALWFIEDFHKNGKLIAAICHAPWLLIEIDMVQGKNVTSWPSLKKDLENAGAIWHDMQVVVDGNIITSRNPHDIPAFNTAIENYLENHNS